MNRVFSTLPQWKVYNKEAPFEIDGQGSVIFKVAPTAESLSFGFGKESYTGKSKSPMLICEVVANGMRVIGRDKKELGRAAKRGLLGNEVGEPSSFWMSFDKENYTMRFGYGYMEPKSQLIRIGFNTSQQKREEYDKYYARISKYAILDPKSSVGKVVHAYSRKSFNKWWKDFGALDVPGQGCVSFKSQPKSPKETLYFAFYTGDSRVPMLVCEVDQNGMKVINREKEVLGKVDDKTLLFNKNLVAKTFWMSFDKANYEMRFGHGYLTSQLQLIRISFNGSVQEREKYNKTYAKITKYGMWDPKASSKDGKVSHTNTMTPFTVDLPPLVMNYMDGSRPMEELGYSRKFLAANQLPEECQDLYQNVYRVELNTPDFPDFSEAINYSIKTPGRTCYQLLKGKALKMGDPGMTYLRITNGGNDGTAPGSPYVMEIWPPRCYSPVHDHANCSAVIKVLQGSITTRWYSSLDPERNSEGKKVPYDQARASAGQVTWIDDLHYQTHELYNPSDIACVTIQCYKYKKSDNVHYEFFDYVRSDGIHSFEPGSDMDYVDFKNIVRKEWNDYLEGDGLQPNQNSWV